MTAPIVLLRSNDYCFLGALRGLAGAGADVIPVTFTWPRAPQWFSEASHYFYEPVEIDNPFTNEEHAVCGLETLGRRLANAYGGRVLAVPSSDVNTTLVADHWERLKPYFRLIGDRDFSDLPMRAIDKGATAAALAAHGVAQPVTVAVDRPEDIDRALDIVPCPAIFKPAVKDLGQSFYRAHNGLKAVACDSRDALRTGLQEALRAGFRVVAQERLPLASAADEIPVYLYRDENGRTRIATTAVKEVIEPSPFGTAVVLRLTWRPELVALAEKVADALDWRGPLMVEMMKDPRDGVWKVIEVNGRPWLFNDFFRQAGFDYMGMLARDARGALPATGEMIAPSARREEDEPVHINLGGALAAVKSRKGTAFDARAAVRQLIDRPGRISFAYIDRADPAPGLTRRCWLEREFGETALPALIAA